MARTCLGGLQPIILSVISLVLWYFQLPDTFYIRVKVSTMLLSQLMATKKITTNMGDLMLYDVISGVMNDDVIRLFYSASPWML